MVKFSKQFEAQLVPEWKEAFVDYWQLKKDLKKIHLLNTNNNNNNNNNYSSTKEQHSSLSNTLFKSLKKFSLFGGQHRDHHEAIHVKLSLSLTLSHCVMCSFVLFHFINGLFFFFLWQVHKKLASSASKGDVYETELLEQFADTDAAKEFFNCLDHQLNKVNQFYKAKEKEFLDRGESLKKQMEILVEAKTALKQQQRSKDASSQGAKDDASPGIYTHTQTYTYTQNKMHTEL